MRLSFTWHGRRVLRVDLERLLWTLALALTSVAAVIIILEEI